MVSTVGVEQSEIPCHRRRLPFPFYAQPNIMNTFGWKQRL
jgi:hypothetical protein